jgi:hypothetical protein
MTYKVSSIIQPKLMTEPLDKNMIKQITAQSILSGQMAAQTTTPNKMTDQTVMTIPNQMATKSANFTDFTDINISAQEKNNIKPKDEIIELKLNEKIINELEKLNTKLEKLEIVVNNINNNKDDGISSASDAIDDDLSSSSEMEVLTEVPKKKKTTKTVWQNTYQKKQSNSKDLESTMAEGEKIISNIKNLKTKLENIKKKKTKDNPEDLESKKEKLTEYNIFLKEIIRKLHIKYPHKSPQELMKLAAKMWMDRNEVINEQIKNKNPKSYRRTTKKSTRRKPTYRQYIEKELERLKKEHPRTDIHKLIKMATHEWFK